MDGPIRRPPFLRSQSDNSSSTVVPSLSFPESSSRVTDGHKTVTPSRPPRNPARSIPNLSATSSNGVTRTGTREEVTPWEMYPAPSLGANSAGSSYLSVSRVQNPDAAKAVPSPPEQSSSKRVSIANSSRPSSSGGSGHNSSLSFVDLSILRRRKSTGSKPLKANRPPGSYPTVLHKPRVTSGSGAPSPSPQANGSSPRLAQKIATVVTPHPHPPSNSSSHAHTTAPQSKNSSRPSRNAPSSFAFGQPLAASHQAFTSTHSAKQNKPNAQANGLAPPVPSTSTSASAATPHAPLQKTPSRSSSEKQADLKFSTADRTILEELRRNISARAAQFVVKGPRISSGSGPANDAHGIPGAGSSLGSSGGLGVGIGMGMGGLGVAGGGRKHHPYPKDEVPYPRSYDREVLDLDVWETLFCQQICESLTWHEFEHPPTKVLDIGCGTGSWILDCARSWRKCHFVGLDVVPVQPDLQQVGSLDLAQRVTWVQSNMLEGLPFPNEEFDFVHIKRIGLGVPEDKWDSLFEEITRVMKPGAAFEMIEEDLTFPGKVVHEDTDDSEQDSDAPDARYASYFNDPIRASSDARRGRDSRQSSRRRSVPARPAVDGRVGLSDAENDLLDSEREDHEDSDSFFTSSGGSRRNSSSVGERVSDEIAGVSSPLFTSTSSTTVGNSPNLLGSAASIKKLAELLPTHPPTLLPSPIFASIVPSSVTAHLPVITTTGREVEAIVEDEEGEKSASLDALLTEDQETRSPSAHTQHPTDATIKPATASSILVIPVPKRFSASRTSLSPSISPASLTPGASSHRSLPPKRPLSASGLGNQNLLSPSISFSQSMLSLSSHNSLSPPLAYPSPVDNTERARSPSGRSAAPFLLRSLPKPPINPRDHSLLEKIYNETQASRFVNLSPLSLLPNILGLHFKDLRTHPPVLFTFPPRPASEQQQSCDDVAESDPDEDAHEAIRPTPAGADTSRSIKRSSVASLSPVSPGSPASPNRTSYFENASEDDHWLSVRRLVKHETPYISIDGSRLSAFSPSTRASFISLKAHGPVLNNTEGAPAGPTDGSDTPRGHPDPAAATLAKFRLPNQRMNIDMRSLNLHLALRVTEIMACSETMWEWVIDYQKKAQREKREREKTTNRVRSRSIDTVHPRNHRAPESKEDQLKTTLVELTREDYDDILRRFYLDMHDSMSLPSALDERFGWSVPPSCTSPERKAFDVECQKYEEWEAEQHPRNTRSTRQRPLSASFSSHFNSLNFDGLPVSQSEIKLPLSLSEERSRRDSARSNPRISRASHAPPSAASNVPPSRRLSRSFRIFIAWKGLEA